MAFMTSNRTAKKHPKRSSFDDQGEYMHDYEENSEQYDFQEPQFPFLNVQLFPDGQPMAAPELPEEVEIEPLDDTPSFLHDSKSFRRICVLCDGNCECDHEENDEEFQGYQTPTHFCSGCHVEFQCGDFEPTQGCSCTPDDADCRNCKLNEIEHFLANGGDIEHIDIGEPVAVASDAPAFPISQLINVPTILNQRSSKFMEWIARIATDGDPFAQRLWRETFPEESAADFQARVIRQGTYSHDRLHGNVKPLYIRQVESLLVQHEQWTHTSVMQFGQLVEICGAAYNLVEQSNGCRMTHFYRAPIGPEVRLAQAVEHVERRDRLRAIKEQEKRAIREAREAQVAEKRAAREARVAEKRAIAEQIVALRARVRAIKEEERAAKVARPNWG